FLNNFNIVRNFASIRRHRLYQGEKIFIAIKECVRNLQNEEFQVFTYGGEEFNAIFIHRNSVRRIDLLLEVQLSLSHILQARRNLCRDAGQKIIRLIHLSNNSQTNCILSSALHSIFIEFRSAASNLCNFGSIDVIKTVLQTSYFTSSQED